MEPRRRAVSVQWIEDFGNDARHAVKTFKKNPGFAAVAMLMLALGIGGATVMFTILNGVLFKPLQYPQPDRLIALQEKTDWATSLGNLWAFAYPNFQDLHRETKLLDAAAWRFLGGTMSAPGSADYVTSLQTSANLFTVLGVSPALGQSFRSEDDAPGGTPVAIISDSLWKRRFGGLPDAIGRTLDFNGQTYTVVGVLPADFRLNDAEWNFIRFSVRARNAL